MAAADTKLFMPIRFYYTKVTTDEGLKSFFFLLFELFTVFTFLNSNNKTIFLYSVREILAKVVQTNKNAFF